MYIQVRADSSVKAGQNVARVAEAAIEGAVRRWARRITRVEVHLSDVNRHKGGTDDKRCVMEARLGGLDPIVVTHSARSVADAIDGAAGKLQKTLQNTLGRLNDR